MDGNLLGTNNLERAIAPSVRTGHLIGAVQAAKVAEGYREGLECGVVGLLQSELSPEALEAARADGVALAAAQLEERRRTLNAIAVETGLYAAVPGWVLYKTSGLGYESWLWVLPFALGIAMVKRLW